MIWSVPKMWEGGEVWILGGGPSIPIEFGVPKEVIQDVLQGRSTPSVYSPYMAPIHKKHVIAINIAYQIGNWMDMVFFGDAKFYDKYKIDMAQWSGLKVCCHQVAMNVPWVKYLQHDKKRPKGISYDPKAISWNGNSGAAAISVAAHTGAKRIILLGFDMQDVAGEKHWHDLYRWDIPIPTKHNKQAQVQTDYKKYLLAFPQIAQDAKGRGIEIINASPHSTIDVFPKVAVKDLL